MTHEKLMAHARSLIWAAWQGSSEELASQAVASLDGLGMLVPEGGAAELERLRLLLNAQPVELTEEQRDALSDAGNRALNDHYHQDLCACRDWPASCASSGNYFMGTWDTAAFDIGMGAVLGLWESMRADSPSAELVALRARVAELEAERHATNEALSDAAEELRARRDRIAELETLKPAPIQTCRTCGAGYDYGQPCSTCKFHGLMAAAQAARYHEGELAEQRHLVDPLDHALEALAPRTTTTIEISGSAL
ncbi:hypothetical protein Q5762_07265 [Streptomyces sp. P9(2023)]|uniref:hypothetical protein n=1 Tax=Streptomyces sp. P9(2023) TaxID=3064394 RepID=UPI0028F4201E|nr:hypothetical protein [Streptomyces sp. P9(2023)]MDT9688155.1 hypothetical protein [Streptomyces sp. P9(2023)]